MHDDMTPTYWALRAEQAKPPEAGGRHRWHGAPQALPTGARRRHSIDQPTEEIPVGRHTDGDNDGLADQVTEPAVEAAYEALATGVLSATDPAADETWPGISELDESGRPDAFPPDWGAQGPTERDQAAIDAGNAPEATDEDVLG